MIQRLRARGDYALWVYSAQTALNAMGYVTIKINEYNDIFAENPSGEQVRMALSEAPNGRVAFMFDADEAHFSEKFKAAANHGYHENRARLRQMEAAGAASAQGEAAPTPRRRGLPKRLPVRAPERDDADGFARADARGQRRPTRASEQPDAAVGRPSPAPDKAADRRSDPFGDATGSAWPSERLDALYEAFRKADEDGDGEGAIFETFDPFAFIDNPRFYFYLGRLARKIVIGIILFVLGYFLGNL